MAQAAKDNVSELNTDLSKQVSILRDDIAALTTIMGDYARAQGALIENTAATKAENATKVGEAAATALKTQAGKTYSDAEETVRSNPVPAVGIAAGLGFVIGMLSARK